MDDKLRAIVTRVEVSSLSDAEKEDVYLAIAESLQGTVWPILLKYMPKDQLESLATDSAKVTVESYGKLIEDTIKDGEALKEISDFMQQILDEVDKTLTEQGIPAAPAIEE